MMPLPNSPPTPWTRLYGTERWRRRARRHLEQNPMCVECEKQGKLEIARVAHHVEEWNPRSTLLDFWNGELEGLCFECHFAEHHNGAQPKGYSVAIGLDGWPLDSRHPTYQSEHAKRERKQR